MPRDWFKRSMIPGILGMAAIIVALTLANQEAQRWLFLAGAAGMIFTALLERHQVFIGLQLIILSGTLAAFLPLEALSKGVIPLIVSIPILIFLGYKGFLDSKNAWIGVLALATLGVGYAVQHPIGFFTGGLLISIFSAMELRGGFKPALIWLLLNLVFALLAGLKLFFA